MINLVVNEAWKPVKTTEQHFHKDGLRAAQQEEGAGSESQGKPESKVRSECVVSKNDKCRVTKFTGTSTVKFRRPTRHC